MTEDTQLSAVYGAVASLADEIAGMIAAWFCRVTEESDHDLALKIIARLVMPGCDHEWDHPAVENLLVLENKALRMASGLPAAGYEDTLANLARLAAEMLSHFTQAGHPGGPCHRSGWIDDETIAGWHRTYRAATAK